jgi:thiamine pyrophosphate-dependent acetolactate synthase large subunit-like protein
MMKTAEVLEIFNRHRGDAVVIPGRGGRYWVETSDQPNRDLPLGDPAMGGHASFALGLALAIPDQRVVLFDSEGDVLMGMGALSTIAEKAPSNLYHFMLDNGVYATTGGQPVPNAEEMEYDVVAQGCGYPSTYAIDNLEDFTSQIAEILDQPGPVFVALKIDPEIINEPINARPQWQRKTRNQAVADMQAELGISVG